MNVEALCALAQVSRRGYYRFLGTPEVGDTDIELRDTIQRIALEFPGYGRPRMTAELHRRGWAVGPNRVYRIMREDNLLCLRRRKPGLPWRSTSAMTPAGVRDWKRSRIAAPGCAAESGKPDIERGGIGW